jgi:hypothetical protein
MTRGALDFGLGLFVIAAGLVMLFFIIPTGVDTPANVPYAVLSPRFWPRVIMYFMMAMGAVVAIKGLLQMRSERTRTDASGSRDAQDSDVGGADAVDITLAGVPYIAVACVLLLGYYWLMTAIGMVEASIVALVVFSALYLERRVHWILAVAVALPLLLYGFFFYIANVPIPLGPLEGVI